MVGMYAAGVTYDVTGKGFDPEAMGRRARGGELKHLKVKEIRFLCLFFLGGGGDLDTGTLTERGLEK